MEPSKRDGTACCFTHGGGWWLFISPIIRSRILQGMYDGTRLATKVTYGEFSFDSPPFLAIAAVGGSDPSNRFYNSFVMFFSSEL